LSSSKRNLTVRFATAADLPIVSDHNYMPTGRVTSLIASQQVVVAEDQGEALGYACFDYFGAIHPFLALIRVFPEYRRQGTGRAILGFLEDHLRTLGHDVLYSSSQADESEPQTWHRRVGFAECGFIAGFNPGGIGEILFRKPLEAG